MITESMLKTCSQNTFSTETMIMTAVRNTWPAQTFMR